MWNKLQNYATSYSVPVCAIGDFNCITDQQEKKGGDAKLKQKHKKFWTLLQRSGLLDLGHSGPAYTWANNQQGRDLILERLDRGVATANWLNLFPNSKVFHLPNYSSDHLPILIRLETKPKRKVRQFRVEQWWSSQYDFGELCERVGKKGSQSWEEMCSDFRKEIRAWEQGGKDLNWEIAKIEEEMQVLINLPQTEAIREKITGLQTRYQQYVAAQEVFWLQRSRLNWALQGDQNTRFFHMTTTVRRRRNRIQAIQTDEGEWLVEEGEIRRLIVRHFKQIFKEDPTDRSNELTQFSQELRAGVEKVPGHALEALEATPTDAEIQWAIFALGPTKAPGPDGINAALIQQQWQWFGPTVISEVKRFFLTGVMKSEIAQSNLVLIPKTETPLRVTDSGQ